MESGGLHESRAASLSDGMRHGLSGPVCRAGCHSAREEMEEEMEMEMEMEGAGQGGWSLNTTVHQTPERETLQECVWESHRFPL